MQSLSLAVAFVLQAMTPASQAVPPAPRFVDPLTVSSLYLSVRSGAKEIGTATGFVVTHASRQYLVTNGHVVTGRHPDTGVLVLSGVPDSLTIWHHGKILGQWSPQIEPLLDSKGAPRWLAHPKGPAIDVVALPLSVTPPDVQLYPLPFETLEQADISFAVSVPVSIIGFPLGLTGPERFAIWKTGHAASDPELDYRNAPAFLVDATTRGGMSGSPVVLRVGGSHVTKDGSFVVTTGGWPTRFLGVYSGRIHEQSEIGIVWKPEALKEVLRQAK
jgi:Trypsin-like peptidase domain